MSLLNVLRRNAISTTSRPRISCSSRLATSQWQITLPRRPLLARLESTTTAKKTNDGFRYPSLLNIHRASTFTTVWTGFFRIASLGLGATALLLIPTTIFDPNESNWKILLYILGAPIPYVVLTLATGPVVHSIKVRLPDHARRSKEALLHFASRTPSDTELRLECIRLLPWPTARHVWFGPLRRVQPSFKIGLSNVEYSPAFTREHKGKWHHELFQRWTGRYWISMDQRKNRSQAPGVWEKMWQQIPVAGSKEDAILNKVTRTSLKEPDVKDRPVMRPPAARPPPAKPMAKRRPSK